MFSNRLAVAALAIGCVTAAAAGGYIAARQSTVPAPAAAQTTAEAAPTAAESSAPAATATKPVQETEALVGDAAKPAPAPAVPVASPPAPVKNSPARRAEAQPPARTERRAPTRETTTAARQEPPPLASTWPASATPSSSPATTATDTSSAPRVEDRTTQEAPRAPEPPQKTFEELVIPADSVVGLQTETKLSSETARVEDRVEARVTRDVRVGDKIAIPAGAHAIGSVMQVERGGKFKERARLGIRFNMLVLADGTRVPISTETIYRDGDAPGNTSAAKVGGGAVGGAILGAILGGAKGAAIGATAGAGGGTAAVMAGGRSEVVLPPGTPMTVRVISPVTVTSEKE